jgi:hypothetical protein
MATFMYDNAKTLILSGQINFASAGLHIMLISGSYPSVEATAKGTHNVTGDIGASSEVWDNTTTGYRRGGQRLTSQIVRKDSTDHEAEFLCANPSWSPTTLTAARAIIWYSGGATPATSYLVQCIDFGGNQTSTNGTFTIVFDGTEGALNLGE